MGSQLNVYITLICTSGVLSLYLCAFVLKQRHKYTKIAKYFIFYTAALAIYCFGAAFGLMATSLEEMKFWTVIQYIGMPISTPLGLLFVLHYLGIKLTWQRCAALLIIPAVSFLMVATNDFHHLHYRIFEIDPTLGVPYIYQEVGSWYLIHGAYTFACMLVPALLILFRWRETRSTYRPQLVALFFGQLVPMATAFIYLVGLAPPGIDPVPMVLWLSSLLYLWSINSSRLFTVMPIAKNTIFNSINDGVVVLDEAHRLIEFNQAAKRMLPELEESLYGMDFETIWGDMATETGTFKMEMTESLREIQLMKQGSHYTYQIRISSLPYVANTTGFLLIFTDITELKTLQLQLEHQAYYDELTNILNRRAFYTKCYQQLESAQKNREPFTVAIIDIDHFKRINDTYGHHTGDQMLQHVVNICKSQLGQDVLFARYGGEEFVLSMKNYTVTESLIMADQIRQQVAETPLTMGDHFITTSISVGIAPLKIAEKESLQQLLNNADIALYAAKKKGRNQVQVYEKMEEMELKETSPQI